MPQIQEMKVHSWSSFDFPAYDLFEGETISVLEVSFFSSMRANENCEVFFGQEV